MKKFILFGMMAIISFAAQAQIVGSKNSRITVTHKEKAPSQDYNRLYVGYANMTAHGDVNGDDLAALQGFKVGYLHAFSITKKVPLYVQAGLELQYGTYGKTENEGGVKVTGRDNILGFNIPVSLTYKYTFKNGLYIEPYAGIRFRLNALTNETYKVSGYGVSASETFNLFDQEDANTLGYMDTFNRFQFGGQFGVNLGYKNFNFNLGYELYTPIYKYRHFQFKYNTFTVGVGMNF